MNTTASNGGYDLDAWERARFIRKVACTFNKALVKFNINAVGNFGLHRKNSVKQGKTHIDFFITIPKNWIGDPEEVLGDLVKKLKGINSTLGPNTWRYNGLDKLGKRWRFQFYLYKPSQSPQLV